MHYNAISFLLLKSLVNLNFFNVCRQLPLQSLLSSKIETRQGLIRRIGKIVYLKMAVICKKCGLPDDLCACGELDKEDTRVVVRLETRRFSKTTTMIEGIDPKLSDIQRIIKELKSRFACGGTAKEGFIMLQGDHRDDVKGYLVRLGFNEAAIEVQ
jgi:translation initiation factor 1